MAARKPATKANRVDAGERLLVEAAQKDPAKFGALYDTHFERIYAFVARRMRDRDKAEDLTSEVFHKALANLKSYTWTGAPFAAWLCRSLAAGRNRRHRGSCATVSIGRQTSHRAAAGGLRAFR